MQRRPAIRLPSWIERACQSETRRLILSLTAAVPLLVGSAALARDTLYIGFQQRALQQTADASALAAAQAVRLHQPAARAVRNTLQLDEQEGILFVAGPFPAIGEDGGIHVTLAVQPSLPLMSMMLGEPATIVAESSAPIAVSPPS